MSGRELGKTSVRILGNPLALPAVVVVAAPAVAAAAAVREALDGDPVSRLDSRDPLPQLDHDAGGLVPQRQSLGLRPVAPVDVKVASADAGLPGIDGDVSGWRRMPLHLLQTDLPDSPIDGGVHDLGGAAGAGEDGDDKRWVLFKSIASRSRCRRRR